MGDVIRINSKVILRAIDRITDRNPTAPADRAIKTLWLRYRMLWLQEKQCKDSMQTSRRKKPRKHAPDDY